MELFRLPGAHALLNIESFIALGFLLALLVRSGGREAVDKGPSRHFAVCVTLCAAVLLVYWRVLGAPFLFRRLHSHHRCARLRTGARFLQRSVRWSTSLVILSALLFLVYWINYRGRRRGRALMARVQSVVSCGELLSAVCALPLAASQRGGQPWALPCSSR